VSRLGIWGSGLARAARVDDAGMSSKDGSRVPRWPRLFFYLPEGTLLDRGRLRSLTDFSWLTFHSPQKSQLATTTFARHKGRYRTTVHGSNGRIAASLNVERKTNRSLFASAISTVPTGSSMACQGRYKRPCRGHPHVGNGAVLALVAELHPQSTLPAASLPEPLRDVHRRHYAERRALAVPPGASHQ
jgi:hypothetical protein